MYPDACMCVIEKCFALHKAPEVFRCFLCYNIRQVLGPRLELGTYPSSGERSTN